MAITRINMDPEEQINAATQAALDAKAAGVAIANDFDPSVTGLDKAVGTVAATLDGTKAWKKWGTGYTQWSPLHPVSGTFGSGVASWDSTALVANLACDTLGGFALLIEGVLEGSGTSNISLRINEATASVANATLSANASAHVPTASSSEVIGAACEVGWFTVLLETISVRSGQRRPMFRYTSGYFYSGSQYFQHGQLMQLGTLPLSEIQSLGIAVDGGNTMGATSIATITRP